MSIAQPFESHRYGTPDAPGEIWRTYDGEYVGFNADGENVSLFMSTQADVPEVLLGLQRLNLEPDMSAESWVSFRDAGGNRDARRGRFTAIIDGVSLKDVAALRLAVKTYGRVTHDTEAFRISWRKDIQRFHDKDRVAHELGAAASTACIDRLAELKNQFAEPVVQENSRLTIPVTRQGNSEDFII